MHLHLEHSDFICCVFLAGIEELDLVTGLDVAVEHLEVSDDTSERVEHGIEDKGLKRCFRISCRSRNPLHDGVENLRHTLACLS